MPNREATLATIQRELTAFARRARSKAARVHPKLSLVTYSMLDHMVETGGCRATDLACHFMLDKSTVSRQTATLERLGLMVRETDPDDHRGQILRPSEEGLRLLRDAHEQRRATYEQRLAGWADDDLERLAGYLQRYNSEG
ncbi:MarR family winged helix-turn-helix transcriptional regulator [Streptacidiphilus griseoplanus]|uniref:MarR family winged helix-turn-helix transcriptional regulator n=1 Tax=Peterkaempfera griseoplana TaxID=66896 RepID=UPI0006E1ED13|nr:MarR family transcriptional regulator [Peterkaempfera griseoplana]